MYVHVTLKFCVTVLSHFLKFNQFINVTFIMSLTLQDDEVNDIYDEAIPPAVSIAISLTTTMMSL